MLGMTQNPDQRREMRKVTVMEDATQKRDLGREGASAISPALCSCLRRASSLVSLSLERQGLLPTSKGCFQQTCAILGALE